MAVPTRLRFVTLDVFTSRRYAGNPLAIIHVPLSLSNNLTRQQKQLIAKEFNLSEVVFLHDPTLEADLGANVKDHEDRDVGAGQVRIDIFTALAEVPFAGHPTIGTANYLLRYLSSSQDDRHVALGQHIHTLLCKAGPLQIERTVLPTGEEGVKLAVAHNLHIHRRRLVDPSILARYPGSQARQHFSDEEIGDFPVVSSVKGMTFILVRLTSVDALRNTAVENIIGTFRSYDAAAELLDPDWDVGIVVTYYYVDMGIVDGVRRLQTRMFGSREDPATGSAASALCGYISTTEGYSQAFEITQGVDMGRRSEIGVRVVLVEEKVQAEIRDLILSGTAVKVMDGTLEIPGLY